MRQAGRVQDSRVRVPPVLWHGRADDRIARSEAKSTDTSSCGRVPIKTAVSKPRQILGGLGHDDAARVG